MFPRMSRIQYFIRFVIFVVFFIAIPLNIDNPFWGATTWMATIFFFLHASICRCHDLNFSGLKLFLFILPFVNVIFLLWLLLKSGTIGPNDYDINASDTVSTFEERSSTDYFQPEQNALNHTEPVQSSVPSKKDRLREVLKANHPYKDMLIRNRI